MTEDRDNIRGQIEKYFEQEYNYLQIAGEEFAEKHRTLGSRLKLHERERKDPFVERLFEAFAFLAGRIHERLDDEWPELSGTLLEQLFPQLLRPFPSCTILEARHRPGALAKPVVIPRGSEIQTPRGKVRITRRVSSAPGQSDRSIEKEEAAEFIFRTTQDLLLRPLQLVNVTPSEASGGRSTLVLRFQLDKNGTFESLDMKRLRLYLHGALSVRYMLLYFFTKHLTGIGVRDIAPDAPTSFRQVPECRISMPSLAPEGDGQAGDLSLIPYARQTFPGYRLLQEYFAYPERFFFLDIDGLDNYKPTAKGAPFEVQITFNRAMPRERLPDLENIRLHCTPMVNLFDRPTEPVAITHRLPEYYVTPDINRRWSREIYAIKNVAGIPDAKSTVFTYLPVTSYDIQDPGDITHRHQLYYTLTRRPASEPGAMADTCVRLFGRALLEEEFPKQTLGMQAILSNGTLPAAKLEIGTLKEPVGESFPLGVDIQNITVPSQVLDPPKRSNYMWALVSHLAVNINSLADTEALKSLLGLYNWTPSQNNPNRKRIQGIQKVHPISSMGAVPRQRFLRGVDFRIDIDPHAFENGEGEISLFGSILHRFLTEHVSLNAVVSLTMVDTETGREYRWMPETGKMPLI